MSKYRYHQINLSDISALHQWNVLVMILCTIVLQDTIWEIEQEEHRISLWFYSVYVYTIILKFKNLF